MLALVQPMSTETEPSVISITVNYIHPLGAPPRFEFRTDTGKNRCLIPDDGTRIELTLAGPGVNYSPIPVLWTLPPLSGGATPVVVREGQTISFEVPKPLSYFNPWIFKLSVDEIDGLNGITSPDFFLVLPPDSTSGSAPEQGLILTYDPQNGEFELDNGMLLRNERTLINTFYPLDIPITVKVAPPSSLTVRDLSIVWASGSGMYGVTTVPPSDPPNKLVVQIGTEEEAAGYGQGFRIGVTFDNGQQILSPDPILINATLGDGN